MYIALKDKNSFKISYSEDRKKVQMKSQIVVFYLRHLTSERFESPNSLVAPKFTSKSDCA